MTPCSALQAFPGGHTPFTTAALPVLTPDLPPAIFFNTGAKWEGTNHCNYVQWVVPWWLCKVWCHYGSLTVSLFREATCELKCFQCIACSPEWNDFGDWAHRTDNNNTQLTSIACNSVSFRSPNGTYFNPFGYTQIWFCSSGKSFVSTARLAESNTQSSRAVKLFSWLFSVRLSSVLTLQGFLRKHYGVQRFRFC